MTYTYRCIGKGTTDSNGVAHITHDCSGNALSDDGYKGVGAGLMDFIASTDAPADISDGSFQSETFELEDCIFYDSGTTGTNAEWWIGYGSMTKTVQSDGTLLVNDSDSNPAMIYANIKGTSSSSEANVSEYTAPYCFEFDVVEIDGNALMHHRQNSPDSQANYNIQDFATKYSTILTAPFHVYTQNDGDKVWWQLDDRTKFSQAYAMPNACRIGIRLNAGASIKFRNFKVNRV